MTGNGKMPKVSHRTPLTPSDIEAMRKKGYNQTQIADLHGVTRQAVSWQKKTYGGFLTPRQQAQRAWPWETSNDHSASAAFQRLRDHGEFMITNGKGMRPEKLARLRSWWKKLHDENVVLEFDPDIPSTPGISPKAGGFRYVPREASDGDLVIRVNGHTNLTEEGKIIWGWPEQALGAGD
jgi:hypothetical protein